MKDRRRDLLEDVVVEEGEVAEGLEVVEVLGEVVGEAEEGEDQGEGGPQDKKFCDKEAFFSQVINIHETSCSTFYCIFLSLLELQKPECEAKL